MATPPVPSVRSSWHHLFCRWLHLQRLQIELRSSRHFAARCEKLGCVHLAELEQNYIRTLQAKIDRLRESH